VLKKLHVRVPTDLTVLENVGAKLDHLSSSLGQPTTTASRIHIENLCSQPPPRPNLHINRFETGITLHTRCRYRHCKQ